MSDEPSSRFEPVTTRDTTTTRDGAAVRPAAELLPLVYDDLRRAARAKLAALAPGQTLQPTALVHEAYLRLIDKTGAGYHGARHFFFAAARAMHDILVEHARAKACLKRGGDGGDRAASGARARAQLDLDSLSIADEAPPDELIALSEVLEQLRARDERQYQIVLLRFFAGCTAQEAADTMELSLRTANREWAFARAWLHKRLSDADANEAADRDPPTPA